MSETCSHVCSFGDCNKTFSRKDRLLIHLRTHTGERPYLCECGKSYARSSHLTRHKETAHGTAVTETFLCEEEDCNQTFSSKQSLHRHIKRKHEKKMYECTYKDCGKSFHKKQQLSIHEFEHTQVKPFGCPVNGCGKRFLLPSKLKQHMKVHAGYSCDHEGCTEVFDNWTKLRQHKNTHRPAGYICTECDKAFSQKSWLQQHMKSHHEEREVFKCPRTNCGRTYLEQRNLTAHIKSFHDGKRFHCEFEGCDRSFTTKQKCQKHFLSHQMTQSTAKLPQKKGKKLVKKKTVLEAVTGITQDSMDLDIHKEDVFCLSDHENDKQEVVQNEVNSHVTFGDEKFQVIEYQKPTNGIVKSDVWFKVLKLQTEAGHLTGDRSVGLDKEKGSSMEELNISCHQFKGQENSIEDEIDHCVKVQYPSEISSSFCDSGFASPSKGNNHTSKNHSMNHDISLDNSVDSSDKSVNSDNNSLVDIECDISSDCSHTNYGILSINDVNSFDNSNINGQKLFDNADVNVENSLESSSAYCGNLLDTSNLHSKKLHNTDFNDGNSWGKSLQNGSTTLDLPNDILSSENNTVSGEKEVNDSHGDNAMPDIISEPSDMDKVQVPMILQCTSKLWNTELFHPDP